MAHRTNEANPTITKAARVGRGALLLRHSLSALAATGSVLCQLEPAHACGETPCLRLNEAQPPDGSVGVPRNTELRARYFGTFEYYDDAIDGDGAIDVTPMRLVPSVGEPILLTGRSVERPEALEAWAVARHAEPLEANTTYELQLPFAIFGDFCSAPPLEWYTISSFTTGADEDHAAPSFAGIESVGYGDRLEGESTCGTSNVIPVYPDFRPARDDSPGTLYNIYVDGGLVQPYAEVVSTNQITSATLFVECGSSALSTSARVAPGARLELRAVDAAGNESAENPAIAIEADCSAPLAPPPEPGVGPVLSTPAAPGTSEASEAPPGDAPADRAASDVDDRPAPLPATRGPGGRASLGGCAVARAPAATPFAMLAGVLALLGRRVARARRRVRASNPSRG